MTTANTIEGYEQIWDTEDADIPDTYTAVPSDTSIWMLNDGTRYDCEITPARIAAFDTEAAALEEGIQRVLQFYAKTPEILTNLTKNNQPYTGNSDDLDFSKVRTYLWERDIEVTRQPLFTAA